MPLRPPIFFAQDDGSTLLDVVIWVFAGAVWLFAQVAAAKKKKAKATRSGASSAPPPAGGAASPTPDELAAIFRRLGADIPGTPPPGQGPAPAPTVSAPARPAPAATQAPRPASRAPLRKPAAPVAPELARRLARARREAEEAARQVEAIRTAENAVVPGVQSNAGEHRALDTSTRHTGMVLPRLYAMGLRLAPLPVLPMPALDPVRRTGHPLRVQLHSRRELRAALVVQTFLRPAKSAAP